MAIKFRPEIVSVPSLRAANTIDLDGDRYTIAAIKDVKNSRVIDLRHYHTFSGRDRQIVRKKVDRITKLNIEQAA